jgi:hypothetical protein
LKKNTSFQAIKIVAKRAFPNLGIFILILYKNSKSTIFKIKTIIDRYKSEKLLKMTINMNNPQPNYIVFVFAQLVIEPMIFNTLSKHANR